MILLPQSPRGACLKTRGVRIPSFTAPAGPGESDRDRREPAPDPRSPLSGAPRAPAALPESPNDRRRAFFGLGLCERGRPTVVYDPRSPKGGVDGVFRTPLVLR